MLSLRAPGASSSAACVATTRPPLAWACRLPSRHPVVPCFPTVSLFGGLSLLIGAHACGQLSREHPQAVPRVTASAACCASGAARSCAHTAARRLHPVHSTQLALTSDPPQVGLAPLPSSPEGLPGPAIAAATAAARPPKTKLMRCGPRARSRRRLRHRAAAVGAAAAGPAAAEDGAAEPLLENPPFVVLCNVEAEGESTWIGNPLFHSTRLRARGCATLARWLAPCAGGRRAWAARSWPNDFAPLSLPCPRTVVRERNHRQVPCSW